MNHPFLGTPILGTPPGYQPVDVSGFVHCQRSSLGFVLVEGQLCRTLPKSEIIGQV